MQHLAEKTLRGKVMRANSTTVAGLDDQTKVGRKRALVRGTGSLLVGVRRGHVIRELARALEHLALVIGTVGVLDLLRQHLDLIRGVRDTDQITPGNAVERVARGADLLVDEVTSPDAVARRSVRGPELFGIRRNGALPRMIERVQPALVRPWVRGWVETGLCGRGCVHLANKRKGSVQVGVPGDGTSRKERRGNEGCSGVHQ